MTALAIIVPILVLPLMFVLQELEQWALNVPKGSPSDKGRQHDRAPARSISDRHPGHAA